MAKTYLMQFGAGDPRTFTGLSPTFLIFMNMSNGATLVAPSISESLTGSGFYQFGYGVTQPIAFLADAATTGPGTAGRYVTGQIDPNDRADEYGNTMIALGVTNLAIATTINSTVNVITNITGGTLATGQINIGTTLVAIGNSLFALGNSSAAMGNSISAMGITLSGTLGAINAMGNSLNVMGSTLLGIGNTVSAIGQSNAVLSVGTTLVAIGNTLSGLVSFVGTTASSFGSTGTDPSTIFGFLKRSQEIQEGDQIYTKASGLLDYYSRGQTTLLREKTISDTSTSTSKT